MNDKLEIGKKYDKEKLDENRFKLVCDNDKDPYSPFDYPSYDEVVDKKTAYYYDLENEEYLFIKVGVNKFKLEYAGSNIDIKQVTQSATEGFDYEEYFKKNGPLKFEIVVQDQILNVEETDKRDIEVKDLIGWIVNIENQEGETVEIILKIYRTG